MSGDLRPKAWPNTATWLEPGTAVLLVLSAEVQGDDVRARIQSAEPLDAAAANMQKGLRVFLRGRRTARRRRQASEQSAAALRRRPARSASS